MKWIIRYFLPEEVRKPLRVIRSKLIELADYLTIKMQPLLHKRALERVRIKSKDDKIKVAFFGILSSVWKYEGIYRLMDQDGRFDPIVVVCPVVNYGRENMLKEMEKAYYQFKSKGYNVVRTYNEKDDTYLDVKKEISPDIVFYTNPYRGLIKDDYYITNFKDTLTCYVQYVFQSANINEQQYNQLFNNILWKAFYETTMHQKMAKEYARNKGENVIITGYPGIDGLVYGVRDGKSVWKNQDDSLKRIIWAPHHTFDKNGLLYLSNFLRYYQLMLDLAEKFRSKIQIAFKPHPLLRVRLYEYEEWGKEKADEYYNKWNNMTNGQLETDDYIQLFNTSDAMILDCISFTTEYLYCGKPSLFTFVNEFADDNFNKFGKMTLGQHYHGYNEKDIEDFVEDVLLLGNDTKKELRDEFFQRYLALPNNKLASQNIKDEICESIWRGVSR